MPRESHPGLLLTLVPLLIGLCESASAQSAAHYRPPCKLGWEFWSNDRAACWPCTRCAPEFTLRPCAVHKDAVCGPLSALELDWSFLSTRKRPETTGEHQPEAAVTSNTLWPFPESMEQRRDLAGDPDDDDDGSVATTEESKRSHDHRERRKSEGHFPWDWQTGALVLAVCACIVFFLVAGCSALVYVRQWRRMKRNFEPAGLEEISARLNLMVKAELAELVAGAPMDPGDPETRCQYLEKLLDRKREAPMMVVAAAAGWPEAGGNLYIEEGDTPGSRRSQIARIHQNIETIVGQKTSDAD